jgi:hypothetical protein
MGKTMHTLYHLTARNNLRSILSEGFRDRFAGRQRPSGRTGVRFSDGLILDRMSQPFAAVEVEVILSERELRQFEWREEGETSSVVREYLIPADMINDHCLLHVISEAEAYALARDGA